MSIPVIRRLDTNPPTEIRYDGPLDRIRAEHLPAAELRYAARRLRWFGHWAMADLVDLEAQCQETVAAYRARRIWTEEAVLS